MNFEQRCKIPSWRRFCGVLCRVVRSAKECRCVEQASPRVSVSATSTVCGSDPATEYWLTVSRILDVQVSRPVK